MINNFILILHIVKIEEYIVKKYKNRRAKIMKVDKFIINLQFHNKILSLFFIGLQPNWMEFE